MSKKMISQLDKILLSQQLALIIESDMSLSEGLVLIAKKHDNPVIAQMLTQIRSHLKSGDTISEAFQKEEQILGSYFVSMILIGEKSGNLQQIFEQMAIIFEREAVITQKIKSAIQYPIILSTFMLGVIVLILVKVLPLFDNILQSVGGEMPALTLGLMNFGQWLIVQGWLIILIIVILLIGLGIYLKSQAGKKFYDQLKFKIPFLGKIVQYAFGSNFARNLSLLIHSGITLPVALEMLEGCEQNSYFKAELKKATIESKSGESLEKIIEHLGIFPWLLIKLVAVAEVSGHLDKVLLKAATTLEQETEIKLKKVLGIIEPLLVTILSLCIGLILISVVLPVFTILNQI